MKIKKKERLSIELPFFFTRRMASVLNIFYIISSTTSTEYAIAGIKPKADRKGILETPKTVRSKLIQNFSVIPWWI